MSFASTITTSPATGEIGHLRLVAGTFTQAGGDTGGTISTGLSVVVACDTTPTSGVTADQTAVSASGGTLTLTTTSGTPTAGTWWAIGK